MKKKTDKKKQAKKKKDKFEDNKNISFNVYEVVLIVFIAIFFGIITGFTLTYKRNPISGKKISKDLQEFITIYDNVRQNYYDDIDEDKLLEAAVSGMIGSLDDPNTLYMNSDVSDDFNESIQGSYIGIGASVKTEEAGNVVAEVYKDSAAEKAGLAVGDIIVKVGDKDVSKLNSEELSKLIRGKVNTTVTIVVKRNDKEKKFKMKREEIELKYASSKIFEENDKKIGYLSITSFSSNIYKQVAKELKSLEKKNIDSLIIDVRNNPGGHLTQVTKILDLFFNKKTILYQIQFKNKTKKYYASDNDKKNYPIVLLGDSLSASASEILISCFKDNYKKATFVGESTYGKGTVQKSMSLSTGASIKYTSQRWLTSKGVWIDGKGIKPDVEVFLDGNYYDNPSDETDNQLQKALEILKK